MNEIERTAMRNLIHALDKAANTMDSLIAICEGLYPASAADPTIASLDIPGALADATEQVSQYRAIVRRVR